MVPYLGWMDEPKTVLTDVTWHPIPFFQKIAHFVRYGKWLSRATRWHSLDMYDINDYKILIETLQLAGMTFRIRYSPDVDYQYVMFLAGSDVDLTPLRIMK